ncbi:unnamed protein product [Paramecium pentaurelia]|uniref:Uncharacterized protein n=1 Tax=Paramecium pentaurelia TaxID=43138 RepID=A0A8S1U2Z2_9CILI|nr:unnamed protein product [Paramecium pentaurelia]
MNYNNYRTQFDNQNVIHSNSQSVGKLKKGIVFQNYPFNPVQSYNSNMQVRPFTSQTQPIKKPSTAQSIRHVPRAATSQTQRQPNMLFSEQLNNTEMETKQSKRYMKIYFLKTNYRTILHNVMNNKLKALPPGDRRRLSVLNIVQDKFKELTIQEINLLICQHAVSEKFYIYFSDSEWIPCSKCCQTPIYLVLTPQAQKTDIFCSQCSRNLSNPPRSAVQSNTILPKYSFTQYGHSLQEQKERQKVSRMIISGKYRKMNLKDVYNEVQEPVQPEESYNLEFPVKEKQQESTILELKDLINELF